MERTDYRISAAELGARMTAVFKASGFDHSDAEQCTKVLLAADLRGIASHGVARLPGYVRLIEAGRINPHPRLVFSGKFKAAKNLDADAAIGLVSGPRAMQEAIAIAADYGAAAVAVHNSNHFGIAGYHASLAAEQGMIGMAFTNASPLVVPFGGKERLLGTNPIGAAFPTSGEPVVIDLATSAAANGKLEIAARAQKPIPPGWAQDRDGEPTTDPGILQHGGALLPLGSTAELGAHKGYALGALVDLLSGVLSGANFGPWVPPFVSFLEPKAGVGKGLGHFFLAIHPEAFLERADYERSIELWLNRFRDSAPAEGTERVLVPGDPERSMERSQRKHGIELTQEVIDGLRKVEEGLKLR